MYVFISFFNIAKMLLVKKTKDDCYLSTKYWGGLNNAHSHALTIVPNIPNITIYDEVHGTVKLYRKTVTHAHSRT